MRPRLLDLFCGAGGCSVGYHRAGFDVVGVDNRPMPRYPFEFHQADALEFLAEHGAEFDAIHASPPCQRYSTATKNSELHPDLYETTAKLLCKIGKPYAIENVIGAPANYGVVLCGSMFGLEDQGEWLQRHRIFETSLFLFQPQCRHPKTRPITITGQAYLSELRSYPHSRQTTFSQCQRLMGIDWMTRNEMAQAIPPAYTEWIGLKLMDRLETS